jgi:hypothetical protein
MKRLADLTPYQTVLPYASEIFGVYQPLIGWKSKRMIERLQRGFAADLHRVNRALLKRFDARFELRMDTSQRVPVTAISGTATGTPATSRPRSTGTFVGDAIARELPELDKYTDAVWDGFTVERLQKMLVDQSVPAVLEWQRTQGTDAAGARTGGGATMQMAEQVSRESAMAGYVLHLKETRQFDILKNLFYKQDLKFSHLQALLKFRDPLDYFDPFKDIERAGLSPIGVVHLFRQYFFEFDTFLGSPVGHVWMSPGSTVELMEVTTRRTLVERTMESELENIVKTEKSITEEDEIADAVKEENKSDTKFGMNGTVNQSWISGSATASSSINLDTTQAKARESTHRHMRQQTEKLSTEIRRNFKSTFRTVTETTDTSSKRYVLQNGTDKLLNYELRRKMRQVGVQVQDIGTYLCWQAYVDDPGRQLGIGKMVHIAKDPELGVTPPPEDVVLPGDHETALTIDIPFVPKTEDTLPEDDMDEAYENGVEINLDTNEGTPEKIQHKFHGFKHACDLPGYQYAGIQFDYGGNDVRIQVIDMEETSPGKIKFGIKLKHINFRNNPSMRVTAKVSWTPTEATLTEVQNKHKVKVDAFNQATSREFKKAFVEAARERIEKASRIAPRKFEELREEERIVVYRALIQDMLTRGIPMPDDRTRHVVSELLNTIFDIDKMLYFVAPEWWRPRLHRSHQGLGDIRPAVPQPGGSTTGGASGGGQSVYTIVKGAASKGITNAAAFESYAAAHQEDTSIAPTDIVSWGGTRENRADNYYITEDSEPARMGSSLGWLLQLDGDNMRNAFLNAPWVKAVIPVRPGKERAAINWLQRLNVEGADGLDDLYAAPAAELAQIPHSGPAPTIRDAINHLCDQVSAKHKESMEVARFPTSEINDDNRVSATPVDKVYEHGFYPLQGGFRVQPGEESFEVFDQWVEVLPTDQVVPVEVTYDPKTGRQL